MSDSDKKKSALDKIVMGAIIGTAIGASVGASMAPKPGKETRELIKKEAADVGKLTKETTSGFLKLAKGIGRRLKNKVLPPKKAPEKERLFQDLQSMRQIPNEMDAREK